MLITYWKLNWTLPLFIFWIDQQYLCWILNGNDGFELPYSCLPDKLTSLASCYQKQVIQLFGNFLVYRLYHGSVFQCVCHKFHYFVLVCCFMFNQALELLFHSSSLDLRTASYGSHNWASLQTYRFRLWVWLGLVCCSLTGLKTTFGLNDIHLAFPVPKFCRQSFIG